MTTRTNHREPFFAVFAWLLLGLVVTGFGGKAVFDTENLPPLTALHHAHAVAMLCWFGLFAIQPTLIRRGNVDLHRRLGTWSPIVVLVFIALAIPIVHLNWGRIGEPIIVTANAINLTLFVILYSSAIAWRRNGSAHKRLMTYAALMLIGPALGRFADLLDQPPEAVAPVIFLLLLTPLVRDLIVRRRPHPATLVGFGLAVAAIPLILGLSGSADWAVFLERVLGPPGSHP